MVRKPEGKLTDYFYREIKKRGGECFKIDSETGFPDRLVLFDGGFSYFVELKAEGEKPRDNQIALLKRLKSKGQHAFCLAGVSEVNEFLQFLDWMGFTPKEDTEKKVLDYF